MINKHFVPYLSFFLLRCNILIFISFNTFAATTDTTNTPPLSSFNTPLMPLEAPRPISPLIQASPIKESISSLDKSARLAENITPSLQQTDTSNKAPYNNLKKIGETFLYENLDNTLLQESIFAFNNAKALYDETNNRINNLTEEMLLEVDQYFQVKLLLSHNIDDSPHYKSQLQTNYALAPLKKISPAPEQNNSILGISSLKEIINMTMLFYLFVTVLLFYFLNWLLRFLLLGKYR